MPNLPKPTRRPWQPAPVKREYQAHSVRTKEYDTPLWRRIRKAHLARHPLCVACEAQGRTTAASVLDHIKPVNQGGDFWQSSNHQSLCNPCHQRKSARERHQPTNEQ